MASALLAVMIWVWIIVMILLSRMSKKNNAADRNRVHGIRDITCRQFGHNHPEWEEPTTRYIVHDDIEDGFIILNGKKMLRTEADQYENTI